MPNTNAQYQCPQALIQHVANASAAFTGTLKVRAGAGAGGAERVCACAHVRVCCVLSHTCHVI